MNKISASKFDQECDSVDQWISSLAGCQCREIQNEKWILRRAMARLTESTTLRVDATRERRKAETLARGEKALEAGEDRYNRGLASGRIAEENERNRNPPSRQQPKAEDHGTVRGTLRALNLVRG